MPLACGGKRRVARDAGLGVCAQKIAPFQSGAAGLAAKGNAVLRPPAPGDFRPQPRRLSVLRTRQGVLSVLCQPDLPQHRSGKAALFLGARGSAPCCLRAQAASRWSATCIPVPPTARRTRTVCRPQSQARKPVEPACGTLAVPGQRMGRPPSEKGASVEKPAFPSVLALRPSPDRWSVTPRSKERRSTALVEDGRQRPFASLDRNRIHTEQRRSKSNLLASR